MKFVLLALAVAMAAAATETKLRRAADHVVAAGVPGTVALVRDNGRTTRVAAGSASLTPKARLRPSDRFRIGSVTKTFVATVVLQLVGEGKLSLDDTVEQRLPGVVPNGERIPVRRLLNMTSGLFDYPDDPRIFAPYRDGDFAYTWTPRELVAVATSHRPLFPPGTRYAYCNTCYIVLGLVVEAVTGNTLGAELERRIFRPLRLAATSFPATARIDGSHAHGHLRFGGRLEDVTAISPSWGWAAGAIVSTADDVARFYEALLRGRLLGSALLGAMRETVFGSPTTRYGLGLGRVRLPCGTAWGHQGGITGYDAWALSSGDGRRQVVVLSNLDGTSFSKRANHERDRLLVTAYCG